MGKFDGILICTDLDGTLMNSKKEISKENLDAIEYFKANGGLPINSSLCVQIKGFMKYFQRVSVKLQQ